MVAVELTSLGTTVRQYSFLSNVPGLELYKLDTAVATVLAQALPPSGSSAYPAQDAEYPPQDLQWFDFDD